jgi:putative MATE family efflux protein
MRPTHMESDLIVLGSTAARLADRQERDQQKWNAILRPIALEIMKWRMILSPNRSHFGGSCAWERNLPDISVVEIPVDEEERPLPPPEPGAKNALLDGPILRTLLWLAWPNVIALSAGTCVVIAETSYIGRLGVESLAAMALVFPFVILTMTMSGGAMGGGVASAVARALGAGDVERASTLAAHALLIGICFGLTFMLGMLMFGPALLKLLGGRGNVLANAVGYAQIFFGGAVLPWLMNTMAGVLRGTGNMKLPSLMILSSAICQIILGGTLGLGLGPIPQFGMRGVAAGSLIAYSISITVMAWYLFSGRARVVPKIRGLGIRRAMFFDILKVGAVSCFSPLQGVLTISIFTHMLAGFGTEILAGYGIGARLEFMLTSVAFATGIASVPMIGMAIGAGRIARARRIAWAGGLVSFVSVGAIGSLIAMFPDLWVNIFTHDPGVRAASRQYLATAGPMYAFIGLAMSMYFSSQGAAKVVGPVLAQSARLLFIALGGWWLSTHNATAANFFALAAASMGVLGVLSASSVVLTRWGPKAGPVPQARPAMS